jgi:8-oxo-dGTP pyrophosphatase MutT (NUDIX family)
MAEQAHWIEKDAFFSRLRTLLQARSPHRLERRGFTQAAVLLVLWRVQGLPHLLFIRRSERVRHHKGEISFPGGTWEPRDHDLYETAIRETHEEVGLSPEWLTPLGRLDDAFSFSRYAIAPYAAALPCPKPLRPNDEVAETLPLPLHDFALDRFTVAFRDLDGEPVPIYTYETHGRIIWGATARILRGFLQILQSDPDLGQIMADLGCQERAPVRR